MNKSKVIPLVNTSMYVLLFIVFIIVITGAIWTTIIPYDTANQHNIFHPLPTCPNPSPVEFWIGYSGIILTFLSIIFVIITLGVQIHQVGIQRKSIKDVSDSNIKNFEIAQSNYDAHVLKLIEYFLSPEMGCCRQRCWLLRQEAMKEGSRVYAEMSSIFKMQITDDWGSRDEYARLQQTELFKDYAEFTKLIRFFDMMSRYNISEQSAIAIHFYYAWWRSFFKSMTDCFKKTFQNIDSNERHLSFMPDWHDVVERMDLVMHKYNLPIS